MDVGDAQPPVGEPALESREPALESLPDHAVRDKDKPDLHFLRLLFEQSGEGPPP